MQNNYNKNEREETEVVSRSRGWSFKALRFSVGKTYTILIVFLLCLKITEYILIQNSPFWLLNFDGYFDAEGITTFLFYMLLFFLLQIFYLLRTIRDIYRNELYRIDLRFFLFLAFYLMGNFGMYYVPNLVLDIGGAKPFEFEMNTNVVAVNLLSVSFFCLLLLSNFYFENREVLNVLFQRDSEIENLKSKGLENMTINDKISDSLKAEIVELEQKWEREFEAQKIELNEVLEANGIDFRFS